jgi:hypothetical protein
VRWLELAVFVVVLVGICMGSKSFDLDVFLAPYDMNAIYHVPSPEGGPIATFRFPRRIP